MQLERQTLTYLGLAFALIVGMGVLFQIFSPGSKITAEKTTPELSPEFSEVSTSNVSQNPPYKATVSINLKDSQGNPLNCQSQAPKAVGVLISPTRSFEALDLESQTQSVSSDCKSQWVLEVEMLKPIYFTFLIKVLDENGNFIFLKKESQIGLPQTS